MDYCKRCKCIIRPRGAPGLPGLCICHKPKPTKLKPAKRTHGLDAQPVAAYPLGLQGDAGTVTGTHAKADRGRASG